MGALSLLSVGMSGQSHVLCYSLKVINMCSQAWITMVWPRDHSHSAVTSGFFCVSWWRCCNTHACRHGGQRWTLGIFSNHSLFHWLTEAVSLTLRLIHLGWLARKPQASACPSSSALRLQMRATVFSFYMNDRNPDSGIHAGMANMSPTKSLPQLLHLILFWKMTWTWYVNMLHITWKEVGFRKNVIVVATIWLSK